jgi:hypothetical protein
MKKIKSSISTETKEQLRARCEELNIHYLASDSVDVLKAKLTDQISPEEMPYAVMDAEDDKQIMAEMRGAKLEDFVYYFEFQNKVFVELSHSGVDELCRQSADKLKIIYELDGIVHQEHIGDYFFIIVKASRYQVIFDRKTMQLVKIPLGSHLGEKRQWKNQKLRTGAIVPDEFYFEKAISKAERNAKHDLLPYVFVKGAIKKFLDRKNKGKAGQPHVKRIQMESVVDQADLQTIHGIAAQYNVSHDNIKTILRKANLITSSLNELHKSQVQAALEIIKSFGKSHAPRIPFDILGLFNLLDYKEPMREAVWNNALKVRAGNIALATEDVRTQLNQEKAKRRL